MIRPTYPAAWDTQLRAPKVPHGGTHYPASNWDSSIGVQSSGSWPHVGLEHVLS